IPVPPRDEQTVKEMVDAQAAAVGKLRDIGAAARANNERRTAALADELNVMETAASAKADAYGIQACGTGSVFEE
ncbi:MAG TPA: hypothetical protein VG455_13285, partial [Acidimicrobiales bacterium]|nr:hypothetical protein [Acidimicrobiales bacterium]